MRCIQCGTNNPPDNNFCAQCGNALVIACVKCGAQSPPISNFCGKCGAPLDAAATRAEAELRDRGRTGERRHLTLLFCDLVDSTSIATQLDPEQWREVIADYHRAAAQAIERFGGHVAQYLGDGVMAYFGWPQAHENDAERAALAGLTILESIARLNEKPLRAKLFARVGIHTGAVVVGAGVGGVDDVFGDVPSIAARVQAAAEPGTVLITGDTHRLVAGMFEVEERGAQPLKGIEQPVQLTRIIQPSGARGRLRAGPGLTPFTGRQDELRLLLTRWERVRRGEGQVVLVVGEPGIGKSRLIRHFHEQLGDDPHLWLECGGDQFAQSTPFYAVGEMLRHAIGAPAGDDAERLIGRLAFSLEAAGLKAKQALPLFASLLNLPIPKNYPPVPADPQEQRRQLLASLIRWATGLARTRPTIMVIEDLQWADASTVEFTNLLVDQGRPAPLMQIYTARPGFECPWSTLPHYAELTLERLSDREAREMVESVASESGISHESMETVVQRATGVPLFVEELTRDLLECGEHSTPRAIPVTLQDLLMARLDRLGPARELAQIGAVIGREFSRELLRTAAEVGGRELQLALDNLIAAGLLYEHPTDGEKSYVFKHALVQDTAYNTLLKSRRRELHQRIAQILEERFPETATAAPELLAYHYTEAGLVAQAVRYWRKAGRRAIERSANVEAITQLRKALALVEELPDNSERYIEEVRLQIALTTPISATKGYLDPEVENACKRALELSREVGETPQLFSVLGALNSIYFNRGELEVALELGRRMLRLADSQRDPVLLLWAHYSLGFTFASQGILKSARDHLEASVALYDPGKGGTYGFVQDPGPTAMVLLAHVIYKLGYPDQALERVRQAVALVRSLSHQFTVAWVLGFAGELYWRRGNKLTAQELWEEMAALSNQQGFKLMIAKASVLLGFALVDQGRGDDGLTKMHDGLYGLIDALPMDERVHGSGFFALALGKAGRVDEGLSKIDEALRLANQAKTFGDLYLLQLIKGQLFLMKNAAGLRKAKQCFSAALELARKQKAKSDELRAAIPMARLLVQQGHREHAREILAKIYNWFTEGFDTADLKEAKALLDELAV